MRILLLASGTGSLARAICEARIPGIEIAALLSDKQCPALNLAQEFNFASQIIPMQADRLIWDNELIKAVRGFAPELVVSVGFMRILSAAFITEFATINTHPALLPLFPGAHAVRDALAAQATVTGTTVHWVDEGVDTGAIIAVQEISILAGDNESTLHERIKIAERALIVETLSSFALKGIPENR